MDIPKHIFKSYDIRGLADTELSDELAYRLGRAYVRLLANKGLLDGKAVVVGRDMRASGKTFHEHLVEGITDEGVDVIDIGMTTTPLFNFTCIHYPEHAGGIMITASHNPSEYNGFKMTLGNGMAVGKGYGMEDLRDMVLENAFGEGKGGGEVHKKTTLDEYMAHIFTIIDKDQLKPLKIVVDAGNGMATVTVPAFMQGLGVEVEYLYLDPDGAFPNHEANPLKEETLVDLQQKVRELGADFGFALDADCDRIGLVDETGEVVNPSFVGALVGLEVLRTHPNATLLYDLRSSRIVPEVWEAAGAKTIMSPVGHANIKALMKKYDATMASELSLHLYFKDMYNVESSDLSLLYIMQLLSREGKPLSEITAPLNKYVHSGEKNFEVEDKDGVIAAIKEKYADEAEEVSEMDGLWMKFDWGFVSVRKSNTEPVLRLNLETGSQDLTDEKVKEFEAMITG